MFMVDDNVPRYDSAETPAEAEPGEAINMLASGWVLFDRYTLENLLGRGGTGVVWRAHDDLLDESVALKFLDDAITRSAVTVENLRQETARARRLADDHIARIHDFMRDHRYSTISMEFVEGETLERKRLAQPGGVFSVAALAPLVGQLCLALDHAHRTADIVHGDLRPSNIMVTPEGTAKIIDFGIASSLRAARIGLTSEPGDSGGTIFYLSPQQLDGVRPSVADDLYALGAIIYELLTGKPPFRSGDVASHIRTVKVPPMAARRSEAAGGEQAIPQEWETTVAACLAKDASQRPSSAGEIARLLGLAVGKPEAEAHSAVKAVPPEQGIVAHPLAAVEPSRSSPSGGSKPGPEKPPREKSLLRIWSRSPHNVVPASTPATSAAAGISASPPPATPPAPVVASASAFPPPAAPPAMPAVASTSVFPPPQPSIPPVPLIIHSRAGAAAVPPAPAPAKAPIAPILPEKPVAAVVVASVRVVPPPAPPPAVVSVPAAPTPPAPSAVVSVSEVSLKPVPPAAPVQESVPESPVVPTLPGKLPPPAPPAAPVAVNMPAAQTPPIPPAVPAVVSAAATQPSPSPVAAPIVASAPAVPVAPVLPAAPVLQETPKAPVAPILPEKPVVVVPAVVPVVESVPVVPPPAPPLPVATAASVPAAQPSPSPAVVPAVVCPPAIPAPTIQPAAPVMPIPPATPVASASSAPHAAASVPAMLSPPPPPAPPPPSLRDSAASPTPQATEGARPAQSTAPTARPRPQKKRSAIHYPTAHEVVREIEAAETAGSAAGAGRKRSWVAKVWEAFLRP